MFSSFEQDLFWAPEISENSFWQNVSAFNCVLKYKPVVSSMLQRLANQSQTLSLNLINTSLFGAIQLTKLDLLNLVNRNLPLLHLTFALLCVLSVALDTKNRHKLNSNHLVMCLNALTMLVNFSEFSSYFQSSLANSTSSEAMPTQYFLSYFQVFVPLSMFLTMRGFLSFVLNELVSHTEKVAIATPHNPQMSIFNVKSDSFPPRSNPANLHYNKLSNEDNRQHKEPHQESGSNSYSLKKYLRSTNDTDKFRPTSLVGQQQQQQHFSMKKNVSVSKSANNTVVTSMTNFFSAQTSKSRNSYANSAMKDVIKPARFSANIMQYTAAGSTSG